ncbi:hypothetical protein C8R43DRAFT_1141599 [Mycena crocata]|nr:hypothetical protein C8R43DRAFT_1141599 [Mycena crocata]
MAEQESSPTTQLANEIMSEIFLHCLPSIPPVPTTHFHVPRFIEPSPETAPLLLCRVSSRWRNIAISTSSLWASLNTQHILRTDLVDLWLERAARSALSMRIAQPIQRWAHLFTSQDFRSPHPPTLTNRGLYIFPMHLHLSSLLPNVPRCRHLEIVNWSSEIGDQLQTSSAWLESLSMVVGQKDFRAAVWASNLIAQSPCLTKLHWGGPAISAPWPQLTHLSWNLDAIGREEFQFVVCALANVIHLRLHIGRSSTGLLTMAPVASSIPSINMFSLDGDSGITAYLTLSGMHHFIVERCASEQGMDNLDGFLHRSKCAITTLELWETPSPSSPPMYLLHHSAIAPSLVRLLLSSYNLDAFFQELEERTPGTLPEQLCRLRDVDRCFRIDVLPAIGVDETTGILGALLRDQFPNLEELDLDDRFKGVHPKVADLESRNVETHSKPFQLRRSTFLRKEYEAWWSSTDGVEFRQVIDAGQDAAAAHFWVSWEYILGLWPRPHPGQNLFANTKRPGYRFSD